MKVGIRSTTLLPRPEVPVTVPNSMLNVGEAVNETVPQRRKPTTIRIAYGTELDAFEQLRLDVADREALVLESPTPRVRFRGFGESPVEDELLCRIPHRPGKAKRATASTGSSTRN